MLVYSDELYAAERRKALSSRTTSLNRIAFVCGHLQVVNFKIFSAFDRGDVFIVV